MEVRKKIPISTASKHESLAHGGKCSVDSSFHSSVLLFSLIPVWFTANGISGFPNFRLPSLSKLAAVSRPSCVDGPENKHRLSKKIHTDTEALRGLYHISSESVASTRDAAVQSGNCFHGRSSTTSCYSLANAELGGCHVWHDLEFSGEDFSTIMFSHAVKTKPGLES